MGLTKALMAFLGKLLQSKLMGHVLIKHHSIGPADLASGTVSNESEVPTVTDNLFSQGTIPTEVIGISYNPG